MGSGDTQTITLTGGGPWGFRLMGGDKFPIQIAKIRKKSKASLGGLQEGDSIISINGVSVVGKSHEDAMHRVDDAGESITIEIQRSGGAQQMQDAGQSVQLVPVVNGSDQPVVSSTSAAYTLDGDNVRTDVVKKERHEVSADGTETKSYMSKQVTNVSSDGVQPTSVTQQTIQVSFSKQSEQTGKENIAPVTGIFTQNKWNTVPQFHVRNVKNTLKPAVHGNIQVRQHSPSPVPTPSVFRPSSPARAPQQFSVASPSIMQPMAPVSDSPQIRHSSPFPTSNMRPTSPSMSPQMRQASPVPTPTKIVPTIPVQYQPSVPPASVPLPPSVPESELYFEVPKPKMPKVEPRPEIAIVDEVDTSSMSAELEEHHHHVDHHEHLPIFAPPVEFYPEDFGFPGTPMSDEGPDLEMRRVMSLESEGSVDGGMHAANRTRRRKLYSDSAFYDDPSANYPTIREQIDLCKKIAKSLTSAANRKARGARMFAKRKYKSTRWIHDGEHHESYSAGDVEDLADLDTEIFIEEGGTRPLFSFRIPNIKKRINPDINLKMSLTQDQFERLRLGSQKSDHRAVSPSTCHSLVADLQSKKNRGARLFQKRQARSEKWVIDESNAKKMPMSPPTRLETMISPGDKPMSPWDAAMQNPIGSVDAAFSRQEQLRKYNQPPPQHFAHPVTAPYQPKQPAVKHNLRTEEQTTLITGPNYNRLARGWGQADDVVDTRSLDRKVIRSQERTSKQEQPPPPPPPPKPLKQQDNYNRKIKAWGYRDDDGVQSSWSSSQQYEPYGGQQGQPQGYRMSNTYSYEMTSQQPMMSQQHTMSDQPMMLPGSDL